jgi:hypothetical protein
VVQRFQGWVLAAGGETEHSTGVKSGTIKINASADAPLVDAEVRKVDMTAVAPMDLRRHAAARPTTSSAFAASGRRTKGAYTRSAFGISIRSQPGVRRTPNAPPYEDRSAIETEFGRLP